MGTILKISELQPLIKPWGSVFVSDDPFGWPFHADIDARILFYPTEGYHLSESQYLAVVKSAKMVGDDGFYVSIIEGEGDILKRGEHWWCEFPSYSEYASLPLVLENTLYSKNSRWGIMVSHEEHAVVGGSSSFIEQLCGDYHGWKSDWKNLKESWDGNPNSAWLDKMSVKES